MREFKRVIYVSHIYQGKRKNKRHLTKVLRYLNKQFPNYLFISPVHAFSHFYKDDDYMVGLSKCLKLFDLCNELWVIADSQDYKKSIGVQHEIDFAKSNNLKIRYITKAYFGGL